MLESELYTFSVVYVIAKSLVNVLHAVNSRNSTDQYFAHSDYWEVN